MRLRVGELTYALIVLRAPKPVIAGERPAHALWTCDFHLVEIPVVSQLCLCLAHLQEKRQHVSAPAASAVHGCRCGILLFDTRRQPLLGEEQTGAGTVQHTEGQSERVRASNGGRAGFQVSTCWTNTLRRVPKASPTSNS